MNELITTEPAPPTSQRQKGRIAIPLLLWIAGVPLGLVVVLWLLFFRGH